MDAFMNALSNNRFLSQAQLHDPGPTLADPGVSRAEPSIPPSTVHDGRPSTNNVRFIDNNAAFHGSGGSSQPSQISEPVLTSLGSPTVSYTSQGPRGINKRGPPGSSAPTGSQVSSWAPSLRKVATVLLPVGTLAWFGSQARMPYLSDWGAALTNRTSASVSPSPEARSALTAADTTCFLTSGNLDGLTSGTGSPITVVLTQPSTPTSITEDETETSPESQERSTQSGY